MREVVVDTETTGLSPAEGHRIVEIGCIELMNHLPSGKQFQRYVNPGRPMPLEAQSVHGLTDEFLQDKPPFADVAKEFLEFIADSPLIIHNAGFDLAFINAELDRLQLTPLPAVRTIDTLQLARQKFPGAPASLDAVCRRFQIDLSDRSLHGALKDAILLAQVYLEMRGGREPALQLTPVKAAAVVTPPRPIGPQRLIQPSAEEAAAHAAFIATLTNPLWLSAD
jgi:DNA polymerase-3 subunit epsilon